ncbi:hypothetical protein [Myroides marinus]|nr:hypothetical protein [Myroides marinus]
MIWLINNKAGIKRELRSSEDSVLEECSVTLHCLLVDITAL